MCCVVCAYGRPVIEYDCDDEPDPDVVGQEFHKEWLRECDKKLPLRRRATGHSFATAPNEQLVGLMMHEARK